MEVVFMADRRQLLERFAQLLDYPGPESVIQARACEELLAATIPAAADYIGTFRRYLERTDIGQVEEAYTAFFDLNPLCAPYLGYQLFGETYRRSVFLLALMERYRSEGFVRTRWELPGSDLPDRISVVLRYAAASGDDDVVTEGLIPSLRRMTGLEEGPLDDGQNTPGTGTPKLEGHSHAGTLEEGVLLEMTEGSTAGSGRRAFEALLSGIRVALKALWSAPATAHAEGRLGTEDRLPQNDSRRVEEP